MRRKGEVGETRGNERKDRQKRGQGSLKQTHVWTEWLCVMQDVCVCVCVCVYVCQFGWF